jgi:beta-lactam-binding protein with PASTA domain
MEALQFLLHQADPDIGFGPSEKRSPWYKLQAIMDYHRKGLTYSAQSPLISTTANERIAQGYAEGFHRRDHPQFPGEVLVLKVPLQFVCDRDRWKSIVVEHEHQSAPARGRRIWDPNHPVFQTCHVLQFPYTGETEQWVFVHQIPAEYVTRSYPFPPDPRFTLPGRLPRSNCNASGGGQAGDPTAPPRSGKLRGKQATAPSTSATSSSPHGKTLALDGTEDHAVRGISIDMSKLYDAVLEYLKQRFQVALQAKLDQISGEFEATARDSAQNLYQDFVYWLNEKVQAEFFPQFEVDSQAFEDAFLAWLNAPGERLKTYIVEYFKQRSPVVAGLIEAYQASWEVADGLGQIWQDAKAKYDRFTRAYDAVVSTPNTPWSDTMEKYGVSGRWMDRFASYEGQINALNERYNIVQAGEIVVGAFQSQSDVPEDKISSLFQLLELTGRAADESRIPIVSFFGQIVSVYAELAKKMLDKIDGLRDHLRKRQDYCLGVGTTSDRRASVAPGRNDVYTKMFGDHTLICPTSLSPDIYERSEPSDGRIYFWVKDTFVEGQELGGGLQGVRETIKLIDEAGVLGAGDSGYQALEKYRGKENDIGTVAEIYNTKYQHKEYGNGIPGLRSEAEATVKGIAERLRALENGIATVGVGACKQENLHAYLEREIGFRATLRVPSTGALDVPFADAVGPLKILYAISYVENRQGGAYRTYSDIWQKLKPLSLIQLHGYVRQAENPGLPCPRCGGATIDLSLAGAGQLTGCEVRTADASGDFVAHIVTNSIAFSAHVSATADGKQSDKLTIDRKAIGVDTVPFVTPFSIIVPIPLLDEVVVPDVTGLDDPSARSRKLRDAGLTKPPKHVGVVNNLSKDKEFKVADQKPRAGTKVPRDEVVQIFIYDKFVERDVIVPNVMALGSEEEIHAVLKGAGLEPTVAPAGNAPSKEQAFKVKSQSQPAGAKVKRGTPVVVLRYGNFVPDTVRVPNLAVFDSVSEMKAALVHVGLKGNFVATKVKTPKPEKAFKHQAQTPVPDDLVERGSVVTVYIYPKFEGDEKGKVPHVIDDSLESAVAKLEAAGLRVGSIDAGAKPPHPEKALRIYQQSPAGGAALPADKVVSLKQYGSAKEAPAAPQPLPTAPKTTAAATPPPQDYRAWMTGTFDTGGGVLKLSPAGGTYEYSNGRMSNIRIEGLVMEGRWEQDSSAGKCPDGRYHGRFRLTFSENGFTGLFGYCDEEPARRGGFQGTRRKP